MQELLVVPIVKDMHWSVAIVFNPRMLFEAGVGAADASGAASTATSGAASAAASGGILFFDSLACHSKFAARKVLMGYLRRLHGRSYHGHQTTNTNTSNSSHQADGAGKAVASQSQAKKSLRGKQQEAYQQEIIVPAPIYCPDVLQQRNGCDCGVFLLQYVEVAFRVFFDPTFHQLKEDALRSKFTSTWPSFGAEAISQKRRYIREKLSELQIAQASVP
jgi:Ulp1 family protease